MDKIDTWLVLDVNNLAWRAYYAMPNLLSKKELPTGVLYGVFRDLLTLSDVHNTDKFAFCFDYGVNKREKDCPGYKGKRKDRYKNDPQMKIARNVVHAQVEKLRQGLLKEIGYGNVFLQDGYEADDMLASVCCCLDGHERAIVVSNDSDLFQLLSEKVSIYMPSSHRLYTVEKFREEWKLSPPMWIDVKAMAGCGTDDVQGISGIGEKTAAKYWRGELKEESHYWKLIKKGWKIYERNIPLVELPYNGTQKCFLRPIDEVTMDKWNKVMRSLDINSLLNQYPGGGRRSRAV